jgi:uncharacterized protein YjbJ (UPF0337 family)
MILTICKGEAMLQEAHGKREKLKGRVKEAAGIVTGTKRNLP